MPGAPRWHDEDDARIIALFCDGGLSLPEVGRAMGRSPDAIGRRLNRLGISKRRTPWAHPYLKDLDGPPIGTDDETIDFKLNARIGSAKLLAEIERVFGRAA